MAKANGTKKPAEPTRSPLDIKAETLRGDIRDAILREFKHLPKPWQQMNEEEQQRAITVAEQTAMTLVRHAVNLVASRGLDALAITVGKFSVDGADIEGKFSAYADDDALLKVRHLADRPAMFVLADPSDFMGAGSVAEPDNVGDLGMPKSANAASDDEPRTAEPGEPIPGFLDRRPQA